MKDKILSYIFMFYVLIIAHNWLGVIIIHETH